MRILVVGAHPADSFDCAGGTCLHHIAMGDTVTAYILTGGSRIHDEVISEQMREKRRIPAKKALEALMRERIRHKQREVIEACGIMGIDDVRFSTLDDSQFLVTKELVRELAILIREVRPHIVITHYPFDHAGIGDQHAITGQAMVHALRDAAGVLPGDRNSPWRVPQTFFMGFPSSFNRSGAMGHLIQPHYDVLIDISDVIHLKREALNKMISQNYHGDNALKRIECVEGAAGMVAKCAYAEPFISYKSLVRHTLPVTSFDLDRARESEKAQYDRQRFVLTRDGDWETYQKRLGSPKT